MFIKILLALLYIGVGLVGGYFLRQYMSECKINNATKTANSMVEDAIKEGERVKKEKLLEAKEEIHALRTELDKESRDRRNELQRLEKRVIFKEENLDKKLENIEKKEETLNEKNKKIELKESELDLLLKKQLAELEKISQLTFEEARELLLANVENKITREMAIMVKNKEAEAKAEADKKAREIISCAIQKCAADHVSESTVSVVSLPSDEMKGRIIGREGRNIRTLETLTGVDLIIDDTPEAVILSAFDPIKREIARNALEKLISDGRIHPARIEEMVNHSKKEIDDKIKEMGEQAVFEVGLHKLHPEIIKLIGRLHYRTSYGQNILKHSLEVAYLAGVMADELGANAKIARRAGLLHDIGKALDHEIEGPHVAIGVDILKRYKENNDVIHAVEAHHDDVEPKTIEAVLVQAADAISAARPGARRETLETYIKRLQKLEEIAMSFPEVDKSFAIQAGREVRILVKSDEIDDVGMVLTAKEIAQRIENELDYPGQIKVNLIRETRVTEYAK
ncbi:MAG: ribonuclease Y [Eubacteriaceae bacterium]|jgi:ribonuclease Y|nr:ribonuclease Y [Eubacteriaceae bacterium]